MPTAPERTGRSATDLQAAIERFLQASRQPALLEPGEETLPLTSDNFVVEIKKERLVIQAWDRQRNLVRRVTGVREEARGRLQLVVERFARKEGELLLIDLDRPNAQTKERRAARLVLRERFRQFLSRQFPDWDVAELTSEPDLEHSLSPSYPRALLRRGHTGWAAMAARPDGSDAASILSFGLIWLDYLRRRKVRMTVEGLALFLPDGYQRTSALRLPFLNAEAARFEIFTYTSQGFAARLDPHDYGNLDTSLEVCRRPQAAPNAFPDLPAVERIARNDGSISLRIHGIEFARVSESETLFGLAHRVPLGEHNREEMEQVARYLAATRAADAADHEHPLYRQNPEAWLESRVRAQIERLDATLLPHPIYGQVPAFAGGERGVLDLLALDRSGRLAVLELKASADLHLPLQALDYWMRVKWHLDRGEFTRQGYFPGFELRPVPPRLLLVSPALEFHPTTEAILGFFSPRVDVERIGLGLEWRKGLEVMFRLRGSDRPIC